ncbi:hypothetical protein XIS1_1310006 [Xenorhabdus innexi]|uniref:Uncharacterized protein n=1 Tax=Xenorhabdus innexi TaxID=290109 RepID=A0A1N6MT48_9GAMM|nr:hypothetical protein XIS1_1310006 [Xenorhabdus innexi]
MESPARMVKMEYQIVIAKTEEKVEMGNIPGKLVVMVGMALMEETAAMVGMEPMVITPNPKKLQKQPLIL